MAAYKTTRIWESKVYPFNTYRETDRNENEKEVYAYLLKSLRQKYILKNKYMASVKHEFLQDGYERIVFIRKYNTSAFRETFIIKADLI